MPRTARVVVPNLPHHIVQRGHNRNAVFFRETDYQYYLDSLEKWKSELGVQVHAWCLMTNHVHLVLNPGENAGDLSRLMKRLAGRQTRLVNKLEGRSGTLWEGRFKSSPIQTDSYLLQCCRYIELNPVRAQMVSRAEDYRWSSFRCKIGLEQTSILDLDPCYQRLKFPKQRYRQFVEEGVPEHEKQFIRERVKRNGLTGNVLFEDEVERLTGIRLQHRLQGRPGKEQK